MDEAIIGIEGQLAGGDVLEVSEISFTAGKGQYQRGNGGGEGLAGV